MDINEKFGIFSPTSSLQSLFSGISYQQVSAERICQDISRDISLDRSLESAPNPLDPSLTFTDLSCDSRTCREGSLFFAIPGGTQDGTLFVKDVLNGGAAGAVIDEGSIETLRQHYAVTSNEVTFSKLTSNKPIIAVQNIRKVLAQVASKFYGEASKSLTCIGITGTNGKTSQAWLIRELLAACGVRAAYVGTLGYAIIPEPFACTDFANELWLSSGHTSPDPISFQKFLRFAVDSGATALCSEVTAHALDQDRTTGTAWDIASFTNLTQDHLDYFKTEESYGSTKMRLFTFGLANSPKVKKYAVLNAADKFSDKIAKSIPPGSIDVSYYLDCSSLDNRDSKTDFKNDFTSHLVATVTAASFNASGTTLELALAKQRTANQTTTQTTKPPTYQVHTPLVGSYNVENLLATIAVISKLYDPEVFLPYCARLRPVPGRLEPVSSGSNSASNGSIFVDYAHTPDALEKAIRSLRDITTGKLTTLFGCGGDRDRTKRPIMGAIAAQLSEAVIITSDNPRSEVPGAIIKEIEVGVSPIALTKGIPYWTIEDRREAIRFAINNLSKGDVLLVAGKGHEDYQEIQGARLPFSDRDECLAALEHPYLK